MNYKKPEIDILMFIENDIITSSILDKNPTDGGGDLDYDADANGV